MRIAHVYNEHPVFNIDRPFSYFIDESLNIKVGVRVHIDFNGQKLVGYVESIEDVDMERFAYEEEMGFALKDIESVIDSEPIFNNELIHIAHYLADQNIAPLISCYQSILPPSLKPNSSNKVKELMVKAVRLKKYDTAGLSPKMIAVLDMFKDKDILLRECSDKYSINKLIEKGLLERFERELYRNPYKEVVAHKEKPTLSNDQQKVLNEIVNSEDQVYLLEGVTGSGKTEIYLRMAEEVLNKGKNVLVLVPEISLTPLMIRRFKERFDVPMAILHSQLSDGEKYDEYRRIKRGEVNIVVGARSACFAPLENIGLIVVDEEHSDSYKEQDNSPAYHMIDVVLERAKYNNCKVILGSATPSLESKARAIREIYHQLYLDKRINNLSLPDVEIVDMLKEVRAKNYSVISRRLRSAITDTLSKGQQVILLLNRRGYSSSMHCNKCGFVFKCPTCNLPLHYHQADNKLKCHYCGSSFDKPQYCPDCGSNYIRQIGIGTQKLEEIIKNEFKDAKVLRMDLDTIVKKGQLTKFLNDFESQQYNVLVGTQIIAKGLDYPNVGLVGVVNADQSLFSGEFRENETTFQLLTQVVGRCGRGNFKGKAIIQTSNPTSMPIVLSATQDYKEFFYNEMRYRKAMKYPPYSYMATITLSSSNKDKVYSYATFLKEQIKTMSKDSSITVLGPSEPHIAIKDGKHRYKLVLKYKDKSNIIDLLKEVKDLTISKDIMVKFDTSPFNIN